MQKLKSFLPRFYKRIFEPTTLNKILDSQLCLCFKVQEVPLK